MKRLILLVFSLVLLQGIALFCFHSCCWALSFEVENGPFSDLVSWVSEATKENILLEPGTEKSITLSASNISPDGVFEFFRAAVAAQNLELVREHPVWIVRHPRRAADPGGKGPVVLPAGGATGPMSPDSPPPPPPVLLSSVVHLDHVQAQSIVPALQGVIESLGILGEQGRAIALQMDNSLMIVGTPRMHKEINQVLRVLDRPVPRVLVEAIIFEASETATEQLGITLRTALSDDGISAASNLANVSGIFGNPAGGVLSVLSGGSLRVLLDALRTVDGVSLLSTPRILVNNRQQGRVLVGQNVPFVTGKATGEGADVGTPFQTIERQDVGVELSVVPVVISADQIELTINQQASSVTEQTFASDIITNKRNITTKVTLSPGETIALGGLRTEDQKTSVASVPFLGSLPYLGRLFRSEKTENVERNLTVFLRVTFG